MNKKLITLISLGAISTLAACSQAEAPQAQVQPAQSEVQKTVEMHVTDVTAVEAAAMIQARPDMVVLDVRTPGEFAAGHIEGAVNIDFKNANFATKIAKLDTSKTYLIHCRSGARSTRSLTAFKAEGFENIVHMNGGILDWNKSGLPTVK